WIKRLTSGSRHRMHSVGPASKSNYHWDIVIEEHFYITSDVPNAIDSILMNDEELGFQWEREGQQVRCLIQEIAEIDDTIAENIQTFLSYNSGHNPMDLEEDPWGSDVCYAEKNPDASHYMESWDYFCKEISERARFFNQNSERILDSIFNGIHSLETDDHKSVIREAGPSTEIAQIFRARVSQSREVFEGILKNPIIELSAPPPKKAKAGRMNAYGISVFYGAADIGTCVSEVRPPVGSDVIVGKFQLLRRLQLLDLGMLSKVYAQGSYFDRDFVKRKSHAAFLKHLVAELTKPVMPEEELLDYLPTQIIAEYLSNKSNPELDGIIFNSTQSSGGRENIVLFQKSSGVEPYSLPSDWEINIHYGWPTEDGVADDSVFICEKKTDNRIKEDPQLIQTTQDSLQHSLRLNVYDDITVVRVKGVEYKSSERSVSRYRPEQSLFEQSPENRRTNDTHF
ncbi:RES family NAD+ phosphorylase, partial [Leptonema illini]|uniref:RES family NAD+ phosphorylase n=2 Tax=Leptonema illini TaxID=183 RepID=UPI001C4DFED8